MFLHILGEYEAFLDDLGIGKKKVKIEEDKPYTPPMGDLRYRILSYSPHGYPSSSGFKLKLYLQWGITVFLLLFG